MDYEYLILLAGFGFALLTSFAALAYIRRSLRWDDSRKAMLAGFAITALSILPILPLAFCSSLFHDFVRNTAGWSFVVPPLCVVAAACVYLLTNNWRGRLLAAVVAVSVPVMLLPDFYIVFYSPLPPLLNQIFTVLAWLAIAACPRFLSGINGLAPIEFSCLGLGLTIVAIIGGAPLATGVAAAAFTGTALALLVYNWYPAKITLTPAALDLCGLLLGWLAISFSAEASGASVYILYLYLLAETAWSLLKRLTFLPTYHDIYANTVYYQANIFGLSPILINNHIIRVNVVLMLFGAFQIYAPNSYSLPLICSIIVAWNMYRLYYWQNQPKKLKELNREFIDEVKENFNKVKKNFNQDE